MEWAGKVYIHPPNCEGETQMIMDLKKKKTKIEAVKIIYLEMFHGKRESKDRYMSTGKFGDELLCD